LLFRYSAGAIFAVAFSAMAASLDRDVFFRSSLSLITAVAGRFGFNVTITVFSDCDSSAVAIDSGVLHSGCW
jgi:hypothetical protein